jgi:hypothetical protein
VGACGSTKETPESYQRVSNSTAEKVPFLIETGILMMPEAQSQLPRKPDFFIVGAPKCGTTSMFEYLKPHPEIFLAQKEIHFFGADLHDSAYQPDVKEYLDLFAGARSEKRIGDASVWYLYSETAAKEIKQFSPEARIVIMLRNPVEMIYSLHSQLLYIGTEDEEDFEKAIEAETRQHRRIRLWQGIQGAERLHYLEAGQYSEQVIRYLDEFGKQRVKVIMFEDLCENAALVVQETCSFLEVDPTYQTEVSIANPNKKVRSRLLRSMIDNPPTRVKTLGKSLTTTAYRQKTINLLRRLNTQKVERPPMPPALRTRLQQHFAPDVSRLSRIINKDLSHWCSSSS